MRVYRPTRKDPTTGKRVPYKVWYVEFRDALEKIRRLPAFSDKTQSEALGRMIDRLVACRVAGNTPDVALGRWLESLSNNLRDKLCELELLDRHDVAASKPLGNHLTDFEAALRAKGNTGKHVKQTIGRLKALFDGCGFKLWSDMKATAVEGWLAEQREAKQDSDGLSRQSSNYYLTAAKSFGKWMIRERRASQSPLEHLRNLNVATDRRHDRRELSVDEVRRLLWATYHGPSRYGLTGPERALVYRLAVESGLRANELRSLTRASFDFRTDPPTVTVEAGSSKRRRRDTLPLRRDTAAELKAHLGHKLPTVGAFALPVSNKTSLLIQADLAAARAAWIDEGGTPEAKAERERSGFLAYVDDAGRFADFHALRHTFLSNLARSGVHPKLAQALARHSTITLTMDRYSHTVLGEQSAAVEALPDLSAATIGEKRATGTTGRIVGLAGVQTSEALCGARKGAICENSVQSVAPNDPLNDRTRPHEKTPENAKSSGVSAVKTARGAGGSRTHGGGFAIRCLSHLATAPS